MNPKELLKKGFLVLVVRVLGAGLSFFSILVFSRFLSVSELGIFSLSLTLITISGVLLRVGVDTVILKQISIFWIKDSSIANGYLFSALKWLIFFGTFFSLLIWLNTEYIAYLFNKPLLAQSLKVFSFVIVPFSLVILMSSAFKAYGKPIYSNFIQSVVAPLVTLVIVCFLWIFKVISLKNIILALLFGFMVSCMLYFYLWNKKFKYHRTIKISLIQLLKEGYPMLLISSSALIMAWSDILILGLFSSEEELGIYSVASKTVMVTSLFLMAMNSITAPRFSHFYKEKKLDKIRKLAQFSSFILLITVMIPIGILFFYSEEVMGLFGTEYIKGAEILIILSVGQFINVSFGSVGYLLSMTGKENILKNIMFLSSIINILLSIIGVKFFGYIGVAYATAFSIILWNTLALIEVKKHLGFWTFSFNIKKEFKK